MKNLKSVLIFFLFAIIIGAASWYGYDLLFRKEKPAGTSTLPTLAPIPSDVPLEMQARIREQKPLEKFDVSISNQGFEPVSLTIRVGDRVRWINNSQENHQPTDNQDLWQAKELKPGDTFTQVFDRSDTYQYYCSLHPELKGTIVVEK